MALVASMSVVGPHSSAVATPPGEVGEIVATYFDGDDHRIVRIDPNATTPRWVSVASVSDRLAGTDYHPSWSPSGMIAFGDRDDDKGTIHTALPNGLQQTPLEHDRNWDVQPAWSPDGGRIAFTTSVGGPPAACTNAPTEDGTRIAYVANGDVFTVVEDGTGTKQVTSTPAYEGLPDWRADGSKIGFWRDNGQFLQMFEIDPDGSGDTPLPGSGTTDQYGPVYSPDGTKALYVGFAGNMTPEIFVRDLATGGSTRLTDNQVADTSPEWSCDGSRVIFASDREGGQLDLYTMTPQGTDVQRLTSTAWDEKDPSYSPDGTKIAYASLQHGDYDVMVMQADGSNAAHPRHLISSSAVDVGPSWSPDGRFIVFQSSRDGGGIYSVSAMNSDTENRVGNTPAGASSPSWGPPTGRTFIYTMNPDGTDARPVTPSIRGGNPAWHPTGSHIAFSDDGDLFAVPRDGGTPGRITADHNGTGRDIEPSYSPDGSRLVFVGVDGAGNSSLWTVNPVGGTGLARVTAGPADRTPVWSPAGDRIAFSRDGDLYTVRPDGSDLKLVDDVPDGEGYVTLDWGTGGPPDTVITRSPGDAVGDTRATFEFRASRFPATFQCKLSGNNGWAGLHDWQDCGSMADAASTEPQRSYHGIPRGIYDFSVRASNSSGTDQTPATHRFEAFSPELVVVKNGTGLGTVTSEPAGITCGPNKVECRAPLSGTVTLTAKPSPGSTFRKWTDGCTGTSRTCTVHVTDKPVFAHAHFELTGAPSCTGEESTHTVGAWELKGCFTKESGKYVTDQPVRMNGIHYIPLGGRLTLDKKNKRFFTQGEIRAIAGPTRTNGRTVGPFVVHEGVFDLLLTNDEFVTSIPSDNFLGVSVTPLAAVRSTGGVDSSVAIPTTLPDVLGGGDGFITYRVNRSNGIVNIRMTRSAELDETGSPRTFDAALGQVFALQKVLLRYDVAKGWLADGTVAMPGYPRGTMTGRLEYVDGDVVAGGFGLRNVGFGGLVHVPKLSVTSTDGQTWTTQGAPVAGRTSHAGTDCGSALQGAFTSRQGGGIGDMRLTIDRCELYGESLVAENVVISPSFFKLLGVFPTPVPDGLVITGDLLGRAAGTQVNAVVKLNAVKCADNIAAGDFGCVPDVTSVEVTADELTFDSLLTVRDLDLVGVPDKGNVDDIRTGKAGWNVTGTGIIDHAVAGTETATFSARVAASSLVRAKIETPRAQLFRAADNGPLAGKPLIDVRDLLVGYDVGTDTWEFAGDVVDAPGLNAAVAGNVTFDGSGNLQSGALRVSQASLLGAVGVNNLFLSYAGPGNWTGSGTVILPGSVQVSAMVGVVDGELSQVSAEVQLGQPAIPIAILPGSSIYRLAMSYTKDPFSLGGGVGAQFGPTIGGVRPLTVDGNVLFRLGAAGQPQGFRLDGAVRLMNLQLAEAYVDYVHPRAIDVRGCLGDCDTGLKWGPARVVASLRGQMQFDPNAFQVEGNASADLSLPTPSWLFNGSPINVGVEGRALLSNRGAAVCGSIRGWSNGWQAGVGTVWGQAPSVFRGCDIDQYRSIVNSSLLAPRKHVGAHEVSRLRVMADGGEPMKAFRFQGETEPPRVNFHRPNGETISLSAETVGQHDDYLLVVDDDTNETILLVDDPEPGTWTVTLQPGSSPIVKGSSADGLAPVEVTASVSGAGSSRTLTWDATAVEGQTLRFVERGTDTSRIIATSDQPSGSVVFTPAPGAAGARTIHVEIVQNGLPRDMIEVATYDAPDRDVLSVALAGKGAGVVTSEPAGISCGDDCEMDLTADVVLTADPKKGSRFVGWSGSCAGDGPCMVRAGETSLVTATFAKVPKPAITDFDPAKAKVGSIVTIQGRGFTYASQVKFGTVKAKEFTAVSNRKITVRVPKGATTGAIVVTTPGGTATSSRDFVVIRD